MTNLVDILVPGYSRVEPTSTQRLPFTLPDATQVTCALANGTCTLIRASNNHNILVDTLGPWDGERLKRLLELRGLHTDDIDMVIGTHMHTDHIGNLNLFQNSKIQFVADQICTAEDRFYLNVFPDSQSHVQLCEDVKVVLTPGHTSNDISVIVSNVTDKGTVAVVGDLFENEFDRGVQNEYVWLEAGSQYPDVQRSSRQNVIESLKPDWIVPGHGNMFRL